MSSPWGKGVGIAASTSPETAVNLALVMSEELARDLQNQENMIAGLTSDIDKTSPDQPVELTDIEETEDDVSSDWLMAQLLQKQFDEEHDIQLSRIEKATNRNSKIGISYEQYKISNPHYDSSSSEDEEPEENWKLYMDQEKISEKPLGLSSSKRGFLQKNGETVTKHDLDLCYRRNVGKMEMFGPTFKSGDGTGMDYRLSNKVFKELKTHSLRQENRAAKLHEKKDNSTAENAMDANTRLVVFKMANNGLLDSVSGCISTGKEANIYHAFGGEGTERITDVPTECALKIHKSTLNEFKCRDQYINNDHRFEVKKNNRRIINTWALKEFLNLDKMRKHGINCPRPVKVKKNVIVMEFIGLDGYPAPTLREAELTSAQMQSAFEQTVQNVVDMYRKCKFVHADLSEYNLLWSDGKVYIIDVGQSVDINNPKSHEFLFRDCKNICSFFSRHLESVPEVCELFNKITGQKLLPGEESDFLLQIQAFESNQELLTYQMSRSCFAFNYFYDKTCSKYSWVPTEAPISTAA